MGGRAGGGFPVRVGGPRLSGQEGGHTDNEGLSMLSMRERLGCAPDGDFEPAKRRAAEARDVGAAVAAGCDRREAYHRGLA